MAMQTKTVGIYSSSPSKFNLTLSFLYWIEYWTQNCVDIDKVVCVVVLLGAVY
jgi:hypothetical protein